MVLVVCVLQFYPDESFAVPDPRPTWERFQRRIFSDFDEARALPSNNDTSADRRTTPFRTLIISYARSGSTMLGQLMSSYPGSVYVVEPLQLLARLTKSTYCESFVKNEVQVLDDVYNCNVDGLKKMTHRKEWWKVKMKNVVKELNIEACENGHLQQIMVKEILFRSTKEALRWLRERQDLRVIHLLRDPRAVWNSRKFKNEMIKWPTSIEAMCYPMLVDLEELPRVLQDRYFRVRYEDFLDDPAKMLAKLYAFAGLPALSEAEVENIIGQYIVDDDSAVGKTLQLKKYYEVKRKKSQIEPDKWKTTLSAAELDVIETTCAKVMEIMQYPCR